MILKFAIGTTSHLQGVLAWLKQEHEETGAGFYCNANIIERCFAKRRAVCALSEGAPVAFAVFYVAPPEAGLEIIEVRPDFRGRGIGRRLIAELLRRLRRRGVEYVDADSTSAAGEALCIAAGFKLRTDRFIHPRPNVLSQLRIELGPKPPDTPTEPASSAA